MINKTRSTLYIGVTNDLLLRISQHCRREIPGFAKDYHCVVLVYCSHFRDIRDAIAWEKQLRVGGVRRRMRSLNAIARTGETWRLIGFEFIRRNSQVLRLRFALQNFAQDDKIK